MSSLLRHQTSVRRFFNFGPFLIKISDDTIMLTGLDLIVIDAVVFPVLMRICCSNLCTKLFKKIIRAFACEAW